MYTVTRDGLEELYHHGIKGMKWGVRRTPEQLGYKTTTKIGRDTIASKLQDVEKGAEFDIKTARLTNDDFRSFSSNQRKSINENRLAYVFGQPYDASGTKYNVYNKDGDIQKVTIHKREDEKTIEVNFLNEEGREFNLVLDTTTNDEYEQLLVSMGYTLEEANDAIAASDLEWLEDQKASDLKELRDSENKFDLKSEFTRPLPEFTKDESWQRKISHGMAKAKVILKKIGNRIVKTAKDVGSAVASAVESGKKWVNKIISDVKTKRKEKEEMRRRSSKRRIQDNIRGSLMNVSSYTGYRGPAPIDKGGRNLDVRRRFY